MKPLEPRAHGVDDVDPVAPGVVLLPPPALDPDAARPLSPPSAPGGIPSDETVPAPPPPPPPQPPPSAPRAAPEAASSSARHDAPIASPPAADVMPGHRTVAATVTNRLMMLPLRLVAVLGIAGGFVLSGLQIARVLDDQPRLSSLAWGSLASGAIGVLAVIAWTLVVTENVRRLLSPATTQQPPNPLVAAATWLVPATFVAIIATAFTHRPAREPGSDAPLSSTPLILAGVSILVALVLMYVPANHLSGVVRKIGGRGVKLAEWMLVPLALGGVSAAMIVGLRVGGAFGAEDGELAPAWVVGVAAIVPAVVVIWLGWRSAAAVEDDVVRAFDRRFGTNSSLTTKHSRFSSMYSDDGPNHDALRTRGHLRQVPGGEVIGITITAGLAGLAMLSAIGSIVMFLFWQEGRDSVVGATQSTRAWEAMTALRTIERLVAAGLAVAATVWAAVAVTNVRIASARHRNPLIAALSWPAAAIGIWVVGERYVAGGEATDVVLGFALQSLLLYVPFALLERSADSVGARRNPFRLACGVGIMLVIHIQGLAGLSTVSESLAPDEFGRVAGYLAIGTFLELLGVFAASGAMRSLVLTTRHVADHHNHLVEQRALVGARQAESYEPARSS